MNTGTIVIIAAALLALVVVILLITKVIKSFLALILLVVIAVGGYLGVRYLNEKTSLSDNVPQIAAAFREIEYNHPEITGIQDNYIYKDLGISIFYFVDGERDDALIQEVLDQTREALLSEENFAALLEQFDGNVPESIGVVFKFNKLDVASYTAERTASEDTSQPDGLYTAFYYSEDN